ncbi:MAG: acyl-CoA thioesterase [Phycisphaeraceae bacterium]|nr:MAG: acyl-CoA thioesterase [Phycisphaeraceae bacterium]
MCNSAASDRQRNMNSPDSEEFKPALRFMPMPRDTNVYGTIFGGVILSWIDQAGFVEARRHAKCRWVTASIERVDFRSPVNVGDLVRLLTRPRRTGTSSLEVEVKVEAERWDNGETAEVTTARLTMVAVDEDGRPFPWNEA